MGFSHIDKITDFWLFSKKLSKKVVTKQQKYVILVVKYSV